MKDFLGFWNKFFWETRYFGLYMLSNSDIFASFSSALKGGENIFNIGRSAKLDYEVLINNIKSDHEYENNAI